MVSNAIAPLLSPRRSGSLAANDPEEREDDPYSPNSKFEGICAGVEHGVDIHFCDTLCKMCDKEHCECLMRHLGCWEDVKEENNDSSQFLRRPCGSCWAFA